MIMFIAPVKNRIRGYQHTGACQWEAQREQHSSTLDDVTTIKPNLTTRLLGSEEHFFLQWVKECWPAGKAVEQRKIHGSTFVCICCILHVILVETVYSWCTGLLPTLYDRNTSLVIYLRCEKMRTKKKQVENVHCIVAWPKSRLKSAL